MKDSITLSSLEAIKAFSDPYRLRILSEFQLLGRPATSKEIADIMKEVPAKVYYHIKKMEKNSILVLTHTRTINGIVARYYEPAANTFHVASREIEKMFPQQAVSQFERLIDSIFTEGRDTFLKPVREKNKIQEGKTVLSNGVIYLTDEELEKHKQYVQELCDNNKKQR